MHIMNTPSITTYVDYIVPTRYSVHIRGTTIKFKVQKDILILLLKKLIRCSLSLLLYQIVKKTSYFQSFGNKLDQYTNVSNPLLLSYFHYQLFLIAVLNDSSIFNILLVSIFVYISFISIDKLLVLSTYKYSRPSPYLY